MATEADIRVDEARVLALLKHMPKEVAKELKPAFRKWVALYRREFKKELRSRRKRRGLGKAEGRYNKGWVTSRLRGRSLKDLRIQMLVRYPFAQLHERGGTLSRRPATVKQHKRTARSGEKFQVGSHSRTGGVANYKATLGAYSLADRIQPRLRGFLLEAADKYIFGATRK